MELLLLFSNLELADLRNFTKFMAGKLILSMGIMYSFTQFTNNEINKTYNQV